MSMNDIWTVRDARSLNYKEKTFLFVAISRGKDGMFAKWDTNAKDKTTVYLFSPAGLSLYENEYSLHENDRSLHENRDSQNPETKINTKRNTKENEKDSASATSTSSESEVKEGVGYDDLPPNLKDAGPASNDKEEEVHHSHIANEDTPPVSTCAKSGVVGTAKDIDAYLRRIRNGK